MLLADKLPKVMQAYVSPFTGIIKLVGQPPVNVFVALRVNMRLQALPGSPC